MLSKYIEGYTGEADYCPFCGCEVDTWHADGSQTCNECGRRYFIIEDDGNEDC